MSLQLGEKNKNKKFSKFESKIKMNNYVLTTLVAYFVIAIISETSALNCYSGIGKNITDKNPAFCNISKNEVCYVSQLFFSFRNFQNQNELFLVLIS